MNDSTSVHGGGHEDVIASPVRRERAGHEDTNPSGPRPAVWTLVALLHAVVFALAGVYVPWDPWAPFAVSCHVLAVMHVASAATPWLPGASSGAKLRRSTLRAVAIASLAHLFVMAIVVARGMALLVEVYGDLGKGLAAAIAAAFCVEVLFTLPIGCWSWARSRAADSASSVDARRRKARIAASTGVVLVVVASAATVEPALRIRPIHTPRPEHIDAQPAGATAGHEVQAEVGALKRVTTSLPRSTRGHAARERVVHRDATCAEAIDAPGLVTAFVAFATGSSAAAEQSSGDEDTRRAEPRHLCVQATPEGFWEALDAALTDAQATRPLRIDVVETVRHLPHVDPLVRPFALRPGLDGVCVGEVCTTPWQLAARRAFISLTPVPTIPDLRMGVDLPRFTGDRDGLVRSFSTRAYLVQLNGDVVPMSRLVPSPIAPPDGKEEEEEEEEKDDDADDDAIEGTMQSAIARATAHIVRAQREDGRFRYTIDPYRARRNDAGVNLPRQAGTTLVLCELADDEHLDTMRRALAYMASQGIDSGAVTALVKHAPPKHDDGAATDPEDGDVDDDGRDVTTTAHSSLPAFADLGSTALPAIAFLACRDRTGPDHDDRIVRMVRFLLAMQLPDGTFHPKWDLRAARPQPGPHPLFAEGQAVYALGLAEALARAHPELGLDAGELHDAVQRSLDHFAHDYWPRVLRDFFFVEENWHCLAARALLEFHRHDGYERFCLDYVTFKRRLLLHDHDRVHEDFVGGYGFGNLVPPQSTPTAGLGEALAAAITIAHARGQDTAALEADLRLVHAFLLRQQIRRERCFGCRNLAELDGGFSESMVSPGLRIDFTQHALAALGHGSEALGDVDE